MFVSEATASLTGAYPVIMEISHPDLYCIKKPAAKAVNQSPVSVLPQQFYGVHIDCMGLRA